jgi:hypothetical protein
MKPPGEKRKGNIYIITKGEAFYDYNAEKTGVFLKQLLASHYYTNAQP